MSFADQPWLLQLNQKLMHFISGDILIKVVTEDWERRQYYQLRQLTFCQEQNILPEDRDQHDFKALAIVAIAQMYGLHDRVIGAVRIFPDQQQQWWGGRLCVDPVYRYQHAVGKALINAAVSTAKQLGCQAFWATVQIQNEAYFHKLSWRSIRTLQVAERPHVLMQAQLEAYPLQGVSMAGYSLKECQR
jgi:putative N-acetyltransferase (TIGR04045 family)